MSQYESQFEENLYQLRRDKLAQIAAIARRLNPALTEAEARYPNAFASTHTIPELRAIGDRSGSDTPLSAEDLADMHIEAAIAGRIMAIRVQGKAGFAQLQQHGQRLQIYVRKNDVGDDIFALYKLLDLGDHIGVRGYLMRTRTGELTLHAAPITLPNDEISPAAETPATRVAPAVHASPAITLLAKAMLSLPDKFHGLEDIELRYRRRYVDLIVNSGTRDNPPVSSPNEPGASKEPGASTEPGTFKEPGTSNKPGTSNELGTSNEPGAPGPDSRTRVEPPPPQTETTSTDTPNVRETFVKRAAILRSIRHFFDTRGYLEVETPMLHTIAGGAAARPFTTHHNALDIPLNLRIAPELYLKRLVVGGLDRVYEINRNFRNEGVSTQHNPEFTMLEFYQAYANYHDLMDLTQELITTVAQEVNGTTLTNFNGTEIDLSKWTKLSMRKAIIKWWPEGAEPKPTEEDFTNLGAWASAMKRASNAIHEQFGENRIIAYPEDLPVWKKIRAFDDLSGRAMKALEEAASHSDQYQQILKNEHGKQIAEVFEILAEEHLIQPAIIYDFPLAVSPLSKIKPDEPDWVERFEFYIGGFEIGNAFSELNDPDDQRRRFEAQLEDRKRGDIEAMAEVDEDYVRALGYGLPPTAGEGIGIDRLTMILTGSRSIRDVILFPLMRPHTQPASEEATE